MTNSCTCTAWGLAISAVLLSPIIVIFLIPLTIGIGLDVFDPLGEVPFALAMGAPLALLATGHRAPPRAALRLRLPLHRSGDLNSAPRSIS